MVFCEKRDFGFFHFSATGSVSIIPRCNDSINNHDHEGIG